MKFVNFNNADNHFSASVDGSVGNDGSISVTLPNGEVLTKDKYWFNMADLSKLHLPVEYCYLYKDIKFTQMRKPHNQKTILVPYLEYDKFKPIIVRFKDSDKEFAIPLPYSYYAVSRDGEVRDLTTSLKLRHEFSPAFRYYFVRLKRYDSLNILVHRLIAFAWIHNDDYTNNYVVDHINSNKIDNRADNLKWVTMANNLTKDATDQCKPVIVRDVDTSVVTEFRSLSEAHAKIGLTLGFGRAGSLIRPGKIWIGDTGRYEAYYKDDFKGWVYEGVIPVKEYRYKVIYNNGNIEYYYTLPEICFKNNLSNKSSADEIESKLECTIKPLIAIPETSYSDIEVYDIKNKTIKVYDKVSSIYRDLGIPMSNIRRALHNKTENVNINGYLIRVKSDSPWDVDKVESRENTSIKIKLTNLADESDVREFDSKKALGREVGLTNHQINNYIEKGLVLERNGKRFRVTI